MEFANMSDQEYMDLVIKKINLIMKSKGLKQQDLSKKSNISQSTLSKLIKGELKINLQHLIKLSKALDIEPKYLLSTDENIVYNNMGQYNGNGIIDETFLDDKILIRDTRHPAFKGYKNNEFQFYCFSTVSSETELLEGVLNFSETDNYQYCKATLSLYTGQIDKNGHKILKYYSGELIISLTMRACYCVLINTEIGEICIINFQHSFFFNRELECRVGAIVSTSSGGNRLPIMQRVLISKQILNVNDANSPDYTFVRGQLNLNDSTIYILEDTFTALLSDTKLEHLHYFFQYCSNYMTPMRFKVIDESKIKDIPVPSDLKAQGISTLRKHSIASKYNKVSSKTEEFVFQYINSKISNKNEEESKE